MKNRMSLTAWLQGISNAIVCAIGVFGTCLTISWLVSVATDRTMEESVIIALATIFVGCLLGLVACWANGLRCRGSLLLDCGGHPARWLFFTMAVFWAVAGVTGSFATNGSFSQLGAMLFALLFSVYWLFMGVGRLGIYEHGIWTYYGLVKWSRVKNHSWVHDGTLLIESTGPLSFLLRGAIPVPNERLVAFKELLSQRLASSPTT